MLEALVFLFHFIRLSNTHAQGTLSVLWHQSLLVLCHHYAAHLAPEQKDALTRRDVVRGSVRIRTCRSHRRSDVSSLLHLRGERLQPRRIRGCFIVREDGTVDEYDGCEVGVGRL